MPSTYARSGIPRIPHQLVDHPKQSWRAAQSNRPESARRLPSSRLLFLLARACGPWGPPCLLPGAARSQMIAFAVVKCKRVESQTRLKGRTSRKCGAEGKGSGQGNRCWAGIRPLETDFWGRIIWQGNSTRTTDSILKIIIIKNPIYTMDLNQPFFNFLLSGPLPFKKNYGGSSKSFCCMGYNYQYLPYKNYNQCTHRMFIKV